MSLSFFLQVIEVFYVYFQGCLPLVLMFDMKEDIDIDQGT